jgi:hypothetical protein
MQSKEITNRTFAVLARTKCPSSGCGVIFGKLAGK